MTKISASEILERARCRLLTEEPFFAHMCIPIDWKESKMEDVPEEDRTIGVKFTNNSLAIVYNPEYIEKFTPSECYGVIKHIIDHLIRLHPKRTGERNMKVWELATDMQVNGPRANPHCGFSSKSGGNNVVVLPFKHDEIIWQPEHIKEDMSAEEAYDYIINKLNKLPPPQMPDINNGGGGGVKMPSDGSNGGGNGDGQDQSQSHGQNQQEQDTTQKAKNEFNFRPIDSHAYWNTASMMSDDDMRAIVNNLVQNAVDRSPGNVPAYLKNAISELKNSKIRWQDILRHFFGRNLGNERKSYNKRSRRHDWFGSKGVLHNNASTLVVIIDTSGSISAEDFASFFGEIEAMLCSSKVIIVQWDTEMKDVNYSYRKGDWQSIQCVGGGGTAMDQAVYWVTENISPGAGDAVVLLTDGYTAWPTEQDYAFFTLISTDHKPGPKWGTTFWINDSK